MTRGGALRAISRLAAPLLQSCTKVHSFAYSPQNTTLPRTASADGNWRFRIVVSSHVRRKTRPCLVLHPPMVTGVSVFVSFICMINTPLPRAA